MRVDANGAYVCMYNEECRCTKPICGKCGWNPQVAEKRLEEIIEKLKEVDSRRKELQTIFNSLLLCGVPSKVALSAIKMMEDNEDESEGS